MEVLKSFKNFVYMDGPLMWKIIQRMILGCRYTHCANFFDIVPRVCRNTETDPQNRAIYLLKDKCSKMKIPDDTSVL